MQSGLVDAILVTMSLAQIEYFVAVAETGAISRAALRLAISQPPLTRQIRLLEDELGTPLFARTPRGVALLPAGHRFLVHAQKILAEIQAAKSHTDWEASVSARPCG